MAMSIFVEMKRRKVLRAAFVYVVMAWLLLQIADVVAPILELPAWVAKLVFFLLLSGLPVMLILAWQFDLTNLGIYREEPLQESRANGAFINDDRTMGGAINCIACLWIVFLGTSLSVGAAMVIHLHEARMIEREFGLVAQELAHEIGHRLHSDNEALQTVEALFIGNQQPNLATFKQVADKVMAERKGIRAIEWVPLVTDDDRASFVDAMTAVYSGFEIKTFTADGEEQVSVQQGKYFPVAYAVPKAGNEAAIGYDLYSNPERAAMLDAAILMGTTRQSEAIRLVQSGTMGYLLAKPVFLNDDLPVSRAERMTSVRGFALGVIDVERTLIEAVANTPGATNFLGAITLYEDEVLPHELVVGIDSSNGSELSVSTQSSAVVDAGFGPTGLVSLQPTRALVRGLFSTEHYVVGVVGVLLSIICALIMKAISSAGTMPSQAGDSKAARDEEIETALLEAAPQQGNRPAARGPEIPRQWTASSIASVSSGLSSLTFTDPS